MGLLMKKRALITGGSSGLGKAIALKFVQEGADIAIFGTNAERAQSVVQRAEELKVRPDQRITYATLDVGKKKEVDEKVSTLLTEWGGVDILVNSAGITRDTLFMKMNEEEWDQVIETNLKSVYNLTHALTRPMMKARSGKIIHITSVIGLTGNPGQVNYSASKLGILGLTRSLARELGPRNINVNCIAPGFFETPMTDGLSDEQKKRILDKVPMGRLGRPEEIAEAALFLASSMSDYMTGQVLTVDGGMIA